MNFQFYLEKLFDSESFQSFIKENKKAYPCSGFFIIDLSDSKKPDNKQHIDYYIPLTKKLFSFKLEDSCSIIPVELADTEAPKKVALNYSFDFNDIKQMIQDEMDKKEVKNKLQKLLFSLQNKDGKDYLVGTAFLSNFGLLKVNIDIADMKIVLFEKKSFMDMMRVVKKDEKSEESPSEKLEEKK